MQSCGHSAFALQIFKLPAKTAQAGERERNVASFFDGCKVDIKGRVVECPGYLSALEEPCDTRGGKNVKYKDAPHRIASGDEVLVSITGKVFACAPRRARRASTTKMQNSDNVTAFEYCTLTGEHGDTYFIIQGTESSEQVCPDDAYFIARADGYFINWVCFKALLESMAERIPGASAHNTRMPRVQSVPVFNPCKHALQVV